MALTIIPIPCLQDNYAYLVFSTEGDGQCVVIDACEAQPVLSEIKRRSLRLSGILTTHHHWDHVGGNEELLQVKKVPVFAHVSESERVPGFSHALSHGEEFEVGKIHFRALHVPGHTMGALSYVAEGVCFTGDTLFCGGCGRLFEGTAAQMHQSLTKILGALPDETLVYTGHEYTQANLEFACGVQSSTELELRRNEVEGRRRRGEFCASATLGLERRTNPFLRCHDPELRAALDDAESEVSAFARLRSLKDEA